MRVWNRATRIPEIYGAVIAGGLILYFFVMYAVGLIHVIELRLLNLFIMATGVYFAMKQYRRTHHGRLDYFTALTTGTASAAIAAATFSLFLFIYLSLDHNLMQSIVHKEPLGAYMNPYIASFVVFLEGIFSGFGVSYLLTNFASSDTPVIDRAVDNMPEI
jgi:hypothetical protein